MSTEFEQGSVPWYFAGAAARMVSVTVAINEVRGQLASARDVAVKEKRPTDQIVALLADLDALEQLVLEQIKDFIQKLAEVEARTRG